MRVKGLADALGSIGAPTVDDDDLVSCILNGLGKEFA